MTIQDEVQCHLAVEMKYAEALCRGENAAAALVSLREDWPELARAANFNAGKLANLLGVSLRTLQRYFKRRNLRVSDWLRELRLKEAYERITAGERVKEVAYTLGFANLASFSRFFKSAYGLPPRVFSHPLLGQRSTQPVEPFLPPAGIPPRLLKAGPSLRSNNVRAPRFPNS